jgi:hypothetical protein
MNNDDEIKKHTNDFLSEWTPRLRMWIKDATGSRRLSEDQTQEYRTAAHYGLMNALATYDKSKGASFDTHASNTVKGHLKNFDAKSGHIKSNVLNQIQQAEREARQERAQTPPPIPSEAAPSMAQPAAQPTQSIAEPKSPALPVQKPNPDRP